MHLENDRATLYKAHKNQKVSGMVQMGKGHYSQRYTTKN